MKKLYTFIALLILTNNCLVINAQDFQNYLVSLPPARQDISCIKPTLDGGFILAELYWDTAGFTSSMHPVLVKSDYEGQIEWTVSISNSCFNCAGSNWICSVEEVPGEGFVALCFDSKFSGHNVYFIIKTDLNGNLQWSKHFDSHNSSCPPLFGSVNDSKILNLASGDFLITSRVSDEMLVLKTDSAGNFLWSKSFVIDTSSNHYNYSFESVELDNGDIITAGIAAGNLAFIKYDANGNLIWSKTLFNAPPCFIYGNSMIKTNDGNLLITGCLVDSKDKGLVVKLDTLCNILWSKKYNVGPNWYDEIRLNNAVELSNSEIMLSGYDSYPNKDFFTKIDMNGNVLYSKEFQQYGSEYFSIRKLDDDSILFGGWDYYFKTGNQGNFNCDFMNMSLPAANSNAFTGNTSSFIIEQSGMTSIPGSCSLNYLSITSGDFCAALGININENSNSSCTIFPNPSSGIFQITFPTISNQKTNYTLEVINTLGQKVFATQPETRNQKPQIQLDLSFLPKGMYVLRLCIPSGKINDGASIASSKLIIE